MSEQTSGLDVTVVPCPDCMVPAGTPCVVSTGLDDVHASRRRNAYLATLEKGTCALCGAFMVRGTDPVDAWHPWPADAERCPEMGDPHTDWNRYATNINLGLTPGHPGVEHFIPDGRQRCYHGALLTDEPAPCGCYLDAPATPPQAQIVEHDADFVVMGGGATYGVLPAEEVIAVCPECRDGKHINCDGRAWHPVTDQIVPCTCEARGHVL